MTPRGVSSVGLSQSSQSVRASPPSVALRDVENTGLGLGPQQPLELCRVMSRQPAVGSKGPWPAGRAAPHRLLPFRNSIAASAVCAFNLSAISQAFNGPFRYQENPRAAWLPIANPIPNFQVQPLLPFPSPHRPAFPR